MTQLESKPTRAQGALRLTDGVTAAKGPGAHSSVIEEMFLSPRVIDRRGFAEYAQALRELIEDASNEAASLKSSHADVQGLREAIERSAKDLRTQLETTLKIIPKLNDGSTRVEQLLAEARERASHASETEQRIESLSQSRTKEIRLELDEALGALMARAGATGETVEQAGAAAVERLEARLTELLTKVESATSKATNIAETAARALSADVQAGATELTNLAKQATARVRETEAAIEARLTDAESRAERLDATLRGAAEGAAERAAEALCRLDERVTAARNDLNGAPAAASDRVSALASEAETRLSAMSTRAETTVETMDRAIDGLIAKAEQAEPLQRLDELRSLVARAEDAADASEEASLASMMARVKTTTESLDSTLERLDQASEVATNARRKLTDTVISSARALDELEARNEKVKAKLAESESLGRSAEERGAQVEAMLLETSAQASAMHEKQSGLGAALRETLELADRADEALEARSRELKELIEAPTAELGRQVEEAGAWLTALIERAVVEGDRLEKFTKKRS